MHLTCTISVDWVCCADSVGDLLLGSDSGGLVWRWRRSDGLIWWSGLTMVWLGIRMWWSDLGWSYWWSCVMVLCRVGSDREDEWSNLSTGLLRTMVLSVGVAKVWSEKWKEEMLRWEVKLLNLALQGSYVTRNEGKSGNTFMGTVATLKILLRPNQATFETTRYCTGSFWSCQFG